MSEASREAVGSSSPWPSWWSPGSVAAAAAVAMLAACVPEAPPLTVDDGRAGEASELAAIERPEIAASSVQRQARQMTVRIRSLGCDGFGVGSGFVLAGDTVVTNRHVVGDPREVTVNTWDGRSFDAEVTGIAVDSDLAVLQLAGNTALPVVDLRREPVDLGEPVIAVGYPDGGPTSVSTGQVVSLVEGELLGEPADVIRIDAPIRQGNSGGPLLDEDGQIVGVVFALDVLSGDGLVVPVQTLLERLGSRELAAPDPSC